MGLILAWISTCLVDAPLSVIALVGGTGVALMVGGYIWPKAARAVQRKKRTPRLRQQSRRANEKYI